MADGSNIGYELFKCSVSKQDFGHTGILHDVPVGGEAHLGVFVFDTGTESGFCHFVVDLYPQFLDHSIPDDVVIGTLVPGWFTNPAQVLSSDLCVLEDLETCGFVPAFPEDASVGKGEPVSLHSIVQNVHYRQEFHFLTHERYLAVVFVPECTDPESVGSCFQLQFAGDESYFDDLVPQLYAQPLSWNVTIHEKGNVFDFMASIPPPEEQPLPVERLLELDVLYFKDDAGKLADYYPQLERRAHDPAVNLSMVIKHVALTEQGRIKEIYGFNGYTDRYYYPDFGKLFEQVNVVKYNYISWSGIMMEFPFLSMLWYGEIIFFASLEEFNECCREFFIEHGNDACPVCGEPLGNHLKYSYIDITRVPHQFWFCSHACLRTFQRRLVYYLLALSKSNIGYLTSIY